MKVALPKFNSFPINKNLKEERYEKKGRV